jgi:LCP family protein required for cell wall assembly
MRSIRRLAAVMVVWLVTVSGLAAAGLFLYLQPATAAFEIHKVDTANYSGAPDAPVFILAIGNDGRPGETVTRGDAIHLIGINPTQGKASMINIPRDSYVNIPGRGRDKINSAHATGGPELEAKAVGDLVGVPVSYVVSTNFEGFTAMVNELGGVDVDVPLDMDDSFSGATFTKGVHHMDGDAALAFSRNRHLGNGDFTRSEDQGILILAALAKLRGEHPSAADTFRYLTVLARHGRYDGLGLVDLARLGRLALSIDPQNVRSVTMPGEAGMAGSASVVYVGPSAPSLFADFADDAVLQSH